jgi:hypothetical protein
VISIRSIRWRQVFVHDNTLEIRNILEILPDEIVEIFIIDLSVQMDQPVSKFGHLAQFQAKIFVEDTLLFKHLKGIVIVLRCPKAFRGNNVIGDVQAAFDAYLEVVFPASDQDLVF